MPWKTVGTHRVLEQSHQASCGYCCVAMVVRLLDGQFEPSEQGVIDAGRRLDPGAYSRAPRDYAGAQPTPILADPKRQPRYGMGTYGQHLAKLINSGNVKQGLRAVYYDHQGQSATKQAMRSVSPQNPLIMHVNWNGGGGHWVVVIQRDKRGLGASSRYTVLDPWGGNVVSNLGSTTYTPPYGSVGSFDGYYISVTKSP